MAIITHCNNNTIIKSDLTITMFNNITSQMEDDPRYLNEPRSQNKVLMTSSLLWIDPMITSSLP